MHIHAGLTAILTGNSPSPYIHILLRLDRSKGTAVKEQDWRESASHEG